MHRVRPALVIAVLSALALIVALLWLFALPADQGAVDAVGARPTPAPTDIQEASVANGPVTSSTPTAIPTGSPSQASFPVPRRLAIRAIDVDTRILPVGLESDGAIEIPADIRLVGWYELGVPPGADRGSAVLVAHRDGREQGRGVFYDLGRLRPGDDIVVRDDAGEALTYSVVAREAIRKRGLPYEELFAVDGPPRLTLISCGGEYDASRGGYQDNIVVTAIPMEQSG